MKVTVLSSSVEGARHQFAASYVVDDFLVVDAGSIGFADIDRQKKVRQVLLSHGHLDHIGSLPIFIDNVYCPGPACPTVFAAQDVQDLLRDKFFNELVWPDVIRLSREESPFIRFETLEHRRPVRIENLTVTPVSINHIVPTFGFVVDDGTSAVAFISDTGPTDEIWEVARGTANLKAVFLEAAFPDSMGWLAEKSKHLTPSLFRTEFQKLGRALPVVAVHIKPAFYDTVVAELQALGLSTLVISQPNAVCEF